MTVFYAHFCLFSARWFHGAMNGIAVNRRPEASSVHLSFAFATASGDNNPLSWLSGGIGTGNIAPCGCSILQRDRTGN